jgi:hypothetical protein
VKLVLFFRQLHFPRVPPWGFLKETLMTRSASPPVPPDEAPDQVPDDAPVGDPPEEPANVDRLHWHKNYRSMLDDPKHPLHHLKDA